MDDYRILKVTLKNQLQNLKGALDKEFGPDDEAEIYKNQYFEFMKYINFSILS